MKYACLFSYRLILAVLVPLLTYFHLRKFAPIKRVTVDGIAMSLGLPRSKAAKFYKHGLMRYVELGFMFSYVSRCGDAFLQNKLDRTRVIGAERLSTVLSSPHPVLIVTMYMGNFPIGFVKLMESVRNQRKVFAFKFNSQSKNEELLFSLFRKTGQDIFPLRAGEEGGKRAFMELRKGNIVALMVDAEVNVTTREEVTFFNQRCFMQSGPATLAVLTNSIIVPVVNYVDVSGQNIVRVEPPLSPEKTSKEESRRDIIVRLTQDIAQQMESWIQIDPAQVQRWPSIAEMMRRSDHTNEKATQHP